MIQLTGLLEGPDYQLDLAAQPQVQPELARVRVELVGADRLRATGPVPVHGTSVAGEFPLVRTTRIVVASH